MSSAIIKECADIWSRLFNHRPFLNGEINLFIKEFEEARGDREVSRLFETLEWITDIRDTQIDKALTAVPSIEKLNTLIDVSLENSKSALEAEKSYDVDKSLAEQRLQRSAELDALMLEVEEKYTKIENTYRDKEKELKEFYGDLERKLRVQ